MVGPMKSSGEISRVRYVNSSEGWLRKASSMRSTRYWFRNNLHRLRKRHLLRDGIYTRLRSFLSLPILLLVWWRAVGAADRVSVQALLNATVTMRHVLLAFGLCLVWAVATGTEKRRHLPLREDLRVEALSMFRGAALCGLILFLLRSPRLSLMHSAELALSLMVTLLAAALLLLLATFCFTARVVPFPSRSKKGVIIGSGPRALALRSLSSYSHERLEIIGCLDDVYVGSDAEGDRYLGALAELPGLLQREPIEVILIGLPVKSHYKQIQDVIDICEVVGVESHYMLDVFATKRSRLQPSPSPAEVAVLGDPPRDLRHLIKRATDLLIAVPLLILVSPLLALLAVAIKLTSPGPVFFVQQRYGLNRQRFPMFKLRTMVVDAEKLQAGLESANEAGGPVFKINRDPRVTKIGSFLRRTSLDELPQLFNVLRGEMALVGPRPLPVRDVSRFDEAWLFRRFSVRPGLTCLWQIKGRSNTKFSEWMKLDLEYVDSWSLQLDFQILAQTIPAVLRGSGAM